MTEVIIGSRESKLAVLQSEMVKSYIEQKNRENNRRYYSGPYFG